MKDNKILNKMTENDFIQLMEAVDQTLITDKVPIPARQFEALAKIEDKLSVVLVYKSNKKPKEKKFKDTQYFVTRVFDWYEKRYDEKLKIDPMGKFAIVLRGEIFKVKLPALMFGEATVECSKDNYFENLQSRKKIVDNYPLNVLDFIEDVTEDFVSTLTKNEMNYILQSFILGNNALIGIENIIDIPLIEQVKCDIDNSVTSLFSFPSQYGLSKWASLQASEKIIKAYIQQKNEKYKYIHKLQELADHAKKLGLFGVKNEYLDLIQCSPEIRYGVEVANKDDAIQAHHANLHTCWAVSSQIVKIKQNRIRQNFIDRNEAIKKIVPYKN